MKTPWVIEARILDESRGGGGGIPDSVCAAAAEGGIPEGGIPEGGCAGNDGLDMTVLSVFIMYEATMRRPECFFTALDESAEISGREATGHIDDAVGKNAAFLSNDRACRATREQTKQECCWLRSRRDGC